MADAQKLWPVLVADLADSASRDFLEGIALAAGKAYLPLIAAPARAKPHLLEVYTPGQPEPLRLFAEPAGPPTAVGFPLKLRPFDPAVPPPAASVPPPAAADEAPRELTPKKSIKHTLSARHTQDLERAAEEVAHIETLVGRTLAGGKLRLDAIIGEGGVGCVYKAFHRDLQIPVAVKVLNDKFQNDIEFCKRFHAEALAASRLDHANLMRVLDFGQEADGLLYLAMEYLDGRQLSASMDPGKPMPLARILDLGVQICAGLGHAHARGIIHRDVKPDNVILVLVSDDDDRSVERVKVCDFGIAGAIDGTPSAIVGTPEYMSPEQCRGDAIDGRSDVYSCGVLLYALATGQLPFTAANPIGIMNRHMMIAPKPPREVNPAVDPALEEVILKALAKDPDERFASMRDLRNALRAVDAPPPKVERAPKPARDFDVPDLASSPPPPRVAATKPKPPPPPPPLAKSGGGSSGGDGDWLERSGSFSHESPKPPQAAPPPKSATAERPSSPLASELLSRPAPWLAAFVTSKKDAYDVLASQLLEAIPALVAERAWKSLLAVRSTVDVLAEDPGEPAWRKRTASDVQHALEDGAINAALAEAALGVDAPPREVVELLLRIGSSAAYAVYSYRLKNASQSAIRTRFVALLERLGAVALPMVRAGLAKLEQKKTSPVAQALAIDLLAGASLVRVRDDEAGEIVMRYLDGPWPATVACAAVEALVGFWGERAKPILVGLLDSPDHAVCIASIAGLRTIRGVDSYVARWISRVAEETSSAEVRAAARAALGSG